MRGSTRDLSDGGILKIAPTIRSSVHARVPMEVDGFISSTDLQYVLVRLSCIDACMMYLTLKADDNIHIHLEYEANLSPK